MINMRLHASTSMILCNIAQETPILRTNASISQFLLDGAHHLVLANPATTSHLIHSRIPLGNTIIFSGSHTLSR